MPIKFIKKIIRNYGKGRKLLINKVLFMDSSKLSTPRSFSMSTMWYIFAGWLLSLSLTFMTLFQNHVEWFIQVFFKCLHLYANWCFSWDILSEVKSLSAYFSWLRFSGLLRSFFLAIRIFRFCFLDLNFTITILFFFFRRWHAWRSSGISSWPVRERALQTLSYSSSLLIDAETGFISIDVRRWYWELFTAFLSSWMICSLTRRLDIFETASSEDRISNLLLKSSHRVVRFTRLKELSSMVINKFIN